MDAAQLFCLWQTGERVMLYCKFCGTHNTFPNGKCINCGASVQKNKEQHRTYSEPSYFVTAWNLKDL